MDQIAVLQYRRGPKRLQIILLPLSAHLAHCALIRIADNKTLTPHSAWRGVPSIGGEVTVGIDETQRFKADVGVEEILRSPWILNGARLEARTLVDLEPGEVVDLQNSRPINGLLNRIPSEVDNWV